MACSSARESTSPATRLTAHQSSWKASARLSIGSSNVKRACKVSEEAEKECARAVVARVNASRVAARTADELIGCLVDTAAVPRRVPPACGRSRAHGRRGGDAVVRILHAMGKPETYHLPSTTYCPGRASDGNGCIYVRGDAG
mmetsp:Transcript_26280/g.66735  ORF Transcript_26280/g.66735 Transcript_26280/m.66735 type:complete len:143 (+) Transcript_26280:564-992(+)